MGHNAADTAARTLRLLNSPELRQHPARGPQPCRPASPTPAAPMDLGLLDYVTAHTDEIVTQTRAAAPDAEPRPLHDEDLYAWYLRATIGADEATRRIRDTLLERHALENALRLGDHDAVRTHPCPTCGGWGLFWRKEDNRAWCSDEDCRTPDGMASSFTPARLASQKVQGSEIWRRTAT
ncbi:hypothetical protein ACWC09_26640 [Streptomyces sp. NPDC001617]